MRRSSIYTDELAAEICQRLANGESLNGICKDDHMPHESTVRQWALDDVEGFAPKYARAREIQAHFLADQIRDIADTPQEGVKTELMPDGGVKEIRADMIEHRRTRIDARKWYLSKVLPKVYGDKVTQEHTGPDGGAPVVIIRRLVEKDGDG